MTLVNYLNRIIELKTELQKLELNPPDALNLFYRIKKCGKKNETEPFYEIQACNDSYADTNYTNGQKIKFILPEIVKEWKTYTWDEQTKLWELIKEENAKNPLHKIDTKLLYNALKKQDK